MQVSIRALCFLALVLSGSLISAAPVPSASTCAAAAEILAITPLASFASIRRADSAPVYEVKYRYCGQVNRLLIQVPVAAHGCELSGVRPLFF